MHLCRKTADKVVRQFRCIQMTNTLKTAALTRGRTTKEAAFNTHGHICTTEALDIRILTNDLFLPQVLCSGHPHRKVTSRHFTVLHLGHREAPLKASAYNTTIFISQDGR